ncbi:WYL domain-containing protein [Thiomonas sp. FB-Cd]|uniref:WYL domain-containing protein n=1 Tax=Thiomonas sp. FB-Cd TaxID=1158292 RepID=UPI0009E0A635
MVLGQDDDGRLEIQATPFKAWLLGYGAAVEVVAPTELRKDMQAMLRNAAKRYQGAT